jgi:hypothetical protein
MRSVRRASQLSANSDSVLPSVSLNVANRPSLPVGVAGMIISAPIRQTQHTMALVTPAVTRNGNWKKGVTMRADRLLSIMLIMVVS